MFVFSLFACEDTSAPPRAAQNPPPPQYGPYGQPPQPYGYPPYGQPPPPYQPYQQPPAPTQTPAPAPAPTVTPPPPPPSRPLLGPLLGPPAWVAEARAVEKELVASLDPQKQAMVATIPLVFDPNPNEVNAFAGCDDDGSPFVAGTEGLLEAIDGIAQTKAADEMFSTQTYDAYVAAVAPRMVSREGGSALLPVGTIAPQQFVDPRRISRAHEMFDEIVGFTFGHELAHHYLGHTGCAGRPSNGAGPDPQKIWRIASSNVPWLNQWNEGFADQNGCLNILDAGRARAAAAYRWNEEGGLFLLDFFGRLDRAAGANPLLGFLRTHPNPAVRVPIVQTTATSWRWQHPG